MATQITTSVPLWLTGKTYDANSGTDLRNSAVTAYFYDPGIAGGSNIGVLGGVVGGTGLAVTAGTGMAVNVQPGSFVVPNTATPTAGGYVSTLPSSGTLTVQTADPSNSRIDIVVAYVSDVGTSSSFGAVQIITGVAAPTPSVPAAPANSITLAKVTVPAAASSITSGMIADQRPFTTTTGGILVAPKGTVTGYPGQVAWDKPSGSFYHNNSTGAQQMKVLPWPPFISTLTYNFNWYGAETTVTSGTITTDGATDIQVFFKWAAVSSNNPSTPNFNVQFRMYIDSTVLDNFFTPNCPTDNGIYAGGSWSYYTSSATGDTPSAGTHTIKVTAQNMVGTSNWTTVVGQNSRIILRVQPVTL
ncbi:hypothetical protein ACIRVF_08365 [Kitasatospora sp. NPDC101157]|uniref:hypothetical protein n=1 Tax=Kitasatospora sp. NPDC101157 TaxID=3364098 RepID=UPI00382D2248